MEKTPPPPPKKQFDESMLIKYALIGVVLFVCEISGINTLIDIAEVIVALILYSDLKSFKII